MNKQRNNSYSPFSKPIDGVSSEDLVALKEVKEGWYVEYKIQSVDSSAIAKSISSFANTYGGWLFFGVGEESKENPVAKTFPGIAKHEVDALHQRIRKSASDHLNPTPYFETCTLWGAVDEVQLGEEYAIVCVWIPQSVNAPHIHKKGQIYRRVADSSEPKPENDRYVVDQLLHRSDEIKQKHKNWFEQDPEFSDEEKLLPYIRLMILADPWFQHDISLYGKKEEIQNIFRARDGVSSIPFDSVYGSADGVIGRQIYDNDLHSCSLTWRLRYNLISDVVIPLQFYNANSADELIEHFATYKFGKKFIDVLGKYKISKLRIVDLSALYRVLIAIVVIQEKLCKLAGWEKDYFFKVKVLNSWRTIPFIDIEKIMEKFDSFGPPLCLDSTTIVPKNVNPESYIRVNRNLASDEIANGLGVGHLMFWTIAQVYGIPVLFHGEEENQVLQSLKDLYSAGYKTNLCSQSVNEKE